jgi:hypothetical protein
MAKYISLVKYTSKGIENVKESPNRLDAFKQLCESMGAPFKPKRFLLLQRKNIERSSQNYPSRQEILKLPQGRARIGPALLVVKFAGLTNP